MTIIGIVGFIGSGKGSVADYLVNNHQFKQLAFADSLKDSVAVIFGWDRDMLEGSTPQSRIDRDIVDDWWAARLNIPNLTPRWVLQHWGTSAGRLGFHFDIWVASLERKLLSIHSNTVISDARFPNELLAVRAAGGKIIRIRRGADPEWYGTAVIANSNTESKEQKEARLYLDNIGIHVSETAWVGLPVDYTLDNNSTIEALNSQVQLILSKC